MIRFTESSGEQFRKLAENISSIDTAYDPEGALPDITIDVYRDQVWDSPPLRRIGLRLVPNGDEWPPYGRADVILDGSRGVAHFDGIELDDGTEPGSENMRGKGIGSALYLAAIKLAHNEDLPFTTQTAGQSEDAVRIWSRMHDLGIAQEVTPFKEHWELVNDRKKFFGDYRIPPTPEL